MELAKKTGGYLGIVNETAQPALTLSSLNDFKLVVPPIKEQYKIQEFLIKKVKNINALIKSKEKLIEELTAYRKSLIFEYVTGKKEVPAV